MGKLRATVPIGEVLTWLAFVVALSPVLTDLTRHAVTHPWARYSLIFFPLLIFASFTDQSKAKPRGSGYLLVLVALVIVFLGAAGGQEFIRFARSSIPLGVVGIALIFGRPSLAIALLSLWAVPLPNAALNLVEPALHKVLVSSAMFVGGPISSIDAMHADPLGRVADQPIQGFESVLVFIFVMAGLGWYAGVRKRFRIARCAMGAAVFGSAGALFVWLVGLIAVLSHFDNPSELRLPLWTTPLTSFTIFVGIACIEWSAWRKQP